MGRPRGCMTVYSFNKSLSAQMCQTLEIMKSTGPSPAFMF